MSDKAAITAIPYIRRCYYLAYADFPTSGIRRGDLAYATDRLVFYRWNGAVWQAVTIHSSSGLAANIPAAADLPGGSLYYTIDTKLLRQVQAGVWVTISAEGAKYMALTVADFQVNAATGTMTTPERLNDDLVDYAAQTGVLGQYGVIAFPYLAKIKRWRQYGDTSNNGDGVWKLEYLDEDNVYHDWVTGIATRATEDWSNLATETEVVCRGIKITATTIDSGGNSMIRELEVIY